VRWYSKLLLTFILGDIVMSNAWQAEKSIEADQALGIIQAQFPELAAQTIESLGAGWDNTAFLVNQQWVFRFPRRQVALPLLEKEIAVLPFISPFLSIPIPVPIWIGKPTKDYEWPFAGYRILPGVTACKTQLSDADRIFLAKPLAEFLAQLHSIAITPELAQALPDHTLEKLDVTTLVPKVRKNLDTIESLGLLQTNDKQILLAISDTATTLRQPKSRAVVHGDLYARHMLVDANKQLAGIIDWGDVHKGDPAVDLSIAHLFLPPSAHDIFRQTYGDIDEDTWQLARLRALYHASVEVIYGQDIGDIDLEQEGSRALSYIISDLSP
jgi:aminoglycoside phosphotransferase (APT) family kinase protein